MAAEYEMRVGHAEREAVATELREHYAVGRLTLDELNERLDKTFAAKTRADLAALMTDLPSAPGTTAGSSAAGPAGTGRDWNGGRDWNSGGRGPGAGTGPGAGRGPAGGPGRVLVPMFFGTLVLAGLLISGGLSVFGMGAARPFGIVLIVAALGVLRRLLFRRRGMTGGRGPRRRRW